jgi:hypothetical protein
LCDVCPADAVTFVRDFVERAPDREMNEVWEPTTKRAGCADHPPAPGTRTFLDGHVEPA